MRRIKIKNIHNYLNKQNFTTLDNDIYLKWCEFKDIFIYNSYDKHYLHFLYEYNLATNILTVSKMCGNGCGTGLIYENKYNISKIEEIENYYNLDISLTKEECSPYL